MHSASDTGPYSSGYCFLYSDDDDYSNEEGCNGTGSETMIWYDNVSSFHLDWLSLFLILTFL